MDLYHSLNCSIAPVKQMWTHQKGYFGRVPLEPGRLTAGQRARRRHLKVSSMTTNKIWLAMTAIALVGLAAIPSASAYSGYYEEGDRYPLCVNTIQFYCDMLDTDGKTRHECVTYYRAPAIGGVCISDQDARDIDTPYQLID